MDAEVDAQAQTLTLVAPPDVPLIARGNELVIEGRRVVLRLKKREMLPRP